MSGPHLFIVSAARALLLCLIVCAQFAQPAVADARKGFGLILADALSAPPKNLRFAPNNATQAGAAESKEPLIKLGVGDTVTVQVYGKPELSTTTYLADDGTILIPLAGAVQVSGLSPSQAAQKVATALKAGEFLVNPQVTIIVTHSSSQQVSVLGEVRTPGRFPVESKTTVFDLLAQAGGKTENGASVIYLLRPDAKGNIERHPIDLNGLLDAKTAIPTLTLQGGDTVFIPHADQFFIYGEVAAPNMYKLEPGMTVVQAISRGGGITRRGSSGRVEIKRRNPKGDYVTFSAKLTDPVMPDDVIRVKESIF